MNKYLFFLLSLICAYLSSNFVMAELNTPTIAIYPDVYYPFDEVLYLEGRSGPANSVQINFQKQGSRPVNFTIKSDSNGEWVLAEKIPLEAGDWEVRAREILSQGKFGEWSNPRVFKVIVTGIIIGGFSIKFAALAFTIILLLISGVLIFWYFNSRVRRLKEIIFQKESAEAHESVRQGIAEIRQDLLDELKFFNSSGKQLSNEESKRKEHILRELDQLERTMEKEIRDLENIN